MKQREPYVFISYHRSDKEIVDKVVKMIEKGGIKTWYDFDDLKPGASFVDSIERALSQATGIIAFISKASSASEYIVAEISFARNQRLFILPIIIEKGAKISVISNIQSLDLSDFASKHVDNSELQKQVDVLIRTIKSHIDPKLLYPPVENKKPLLDRLFEKIRQPDVSIEQITKPGSKRKTIQNDDLKKIASSIANERRGKKITTKSIATPKSLFIVHGKDSGLLAEVEGYIESLGIKSVVLTKIGGAEKSLFQKFLSWSAESRFAIVLISADDLGASRQQYEIPEVGDRSLQFRARQNVILELGFFYGYLGWENVFVMLKHPDRPFPNFEFPSDLSGVVYDSIDNQGNWKLLIKQRLESAGFEMV